jgi:hypothetical protein
MEWQRCPDGVELVDYGRKDTEPGATLLTGEAGKHGKWFRYRSRERASVRYEVTDLENPISMHFLNARDDEARLAFLSRFGMRLDEAEEERKIFVERQKALYRLFEGWNDDGASSVADINKMIGGISLTPSFDLLGPQRQRRMFLRPRNLWQFMCMEVAIAAANDARLATCEHCGKVFLTGPLTGRRSHAKYCSDRCRVAAMRKRNAEVAR